jgi:hypothetical protein
MAGVLGAQPMTGESIARRLCREGRGGAASGARATGPIGPETPPDTATRRVPEHDIRPAQAGWGVPKSHTQMI